jgi:hypothetical protein
MRRGDLLKMITIAQIVNNGDEVLREGKNVVNMSEDSIEAAFAAHHAYKY